MPQEELIGRRKELVLISSRLKSTTSVNVEIFYSFGRLHLRFELNNWGLNKYVKSNDNSPETKSDVKSLSTSRTQT